jgi:hypothetical protein
VQELSKTHETIAKAKTEIQHRILTHYLPLYFPEIDRFRGNSRSDWFFAFLDAFPTPASIVALSKESSPSRVREQGRIKARGAGGDQRSGSSRLRCLNLDITRSGSMRQPE